jgi:hypothetical protein
MEKINLTKKQSLFLIWNSILNQSQNAEYSIKSTVILMERLNLIDNFEEAYDSLNDDKIIAAFNYYPKIHRFSNRMCQYIILSLDLINKSLDLNYIFKDSNKIIENLTLFPGIGFHKAKLTQCFIEYYCSIGFDSDKYFYEILEICPSFSKNIELMINTINKLGE